MIVADASSIISLAMNCMSPILKLMDANIVVTPTVYDEIITNPIKSKRYALEAMRIQRLFLDNVVSVRETDRGLTDEILNTVNSIFEVKNKPLKIIHKGEAEALSLAKTISASALLIDERTTRMLIEEPEGLKDVLSRRTESKIRMSDDQLKKFERIAPKLPVLRSTEIAVRAYEKGLLEGFLAEGKGDMLEAILCALKFSGCAISWDEIDEYKKIIR